MPYTIQEWLTRNKTSRSNLHNMRKAGRGPRITFISPRRGIITEEDDAAFIRARQAEAEAKGTRDQNDGTP